MLPTPSDRRGAGRASEVWGEQCQGKSAEESGEAGTRAESAAKSRDEGPACTEAAPAVLPWSAVVQTSGGGGRSAAGDPNKGAPGEPITGERGGGGVAVWIRRLSTHPRAGRGVPGSPCDAGGGVRVTAGPLA